MELLHWCLLGWSIRRQQICEFLIGNAHLLVGIHRPRQLYREHMLAHERVLLHQHSVNKRRTAAVVGAHKAGVRPPGAPLNAIQFSLGWADEAGDRVSVKEVKGLEQWLVKNKLQSRHEVVREASLAALLSLPPHFQQ